MPRIVYQDQSYSLDGDETVLECLTRNGVSVPCGCRAGACQSCLMQALEGAPPADSQNGLKDTQRFARQFLACVCRPSEDLRVTLPGDATQIYNGQVQDIQSLSANTVRLRLSKPDGFNYFAGQFINLHLPDGGVRSYSLASVPALDADLELHVRIYPNGIASRWIAETLQPGDAVSFSAAKGQCFYAPTQLDQPLLLIGTGTGLAPLYGIVRDALNQGHRGTIQLFHGSSSEDGIYYRDALQALAREYAQLNYTPCVSRPHTQDWLASGRADTLALEAVTNTLKGWRVYLCGHPDMVQSTRTQVFLAGALMRDIYADPFTYNAR